MLLRENMGLVCPCEGLSDKDNDCSKTTCYNPEDDACYLRIECGSDERECVMALPPESPPGLPGLPPPLLSLPPSPGIPPMSPPESAFDSYSPLADTSVLVRIPTILAVSPPSSPGGDGRDLAVFCYGAMGGATVSVVGALLCLVWKKSRKGCKGCKRRAHVSSVELSDASQGENAENKRCPLHSTLTI